jgi:hypothetical protein
MYDVFLPRPAFIDPRDVRILQIRQSSAEKQRTPRASEKQRTPRACIVVSLSASMLSNLILAAFIIYLTHILYRDTSGEGGKISMASRTDVTFNPTSICLQCRSPKTNSKPPICYHHSNEHTIMLMKLVSGDLNMNIIVIRLILNLKSDWLLFLFTDVRSEAEPDRVSVRSLYSHAVTRYMYLQCSWLGSL